MSEKDYLKDISEIKNLMNKSSRFISLSGWAGIFAGVYALTGAFIAYYLVSQTGSEYLELDGNVFKLLVLDLFLIAVVSISTAIFITTRKAKSDGVKMWDASTKRLLWSFIVPMIAGGIYILIILNQQLYGQTGALMLIFYGLALVNASKYTISNVIYLGYAEIFLGLVCALFPEYGFWLWVLGFGILHIIYGSFVLVKEEK